MISEGEWTGHKPWIAEKKNVWLLLGKADGKRPLARQRLTWVDNMKMNFRQTGQGGLHWFDQAQDRNLWNTVMKLLITENVGKFLNSCTTGSKESNSQRYSVSSQHVKKFLLSLYEQNVVTLAFQFLISSNLISSFSKQQNTLSICTYCVCRCRMFKKTLLIC
jgi:hypothetical protein